MAEFFWMGGYWHFVWPAYALATAALGWLAHSSISALSRAEHQLRQQGTAQRTQDGQA